MTNLDSVLTANKGPSSQSYSFSSSHVWMWELDYKEKWVPKNWCFWTVVLEKTLESPLDCKEIQLVNAKGNQSWKFIGRTDAEAEAPILWPPNVKSQLIRKASDGGKDCRQEEKETTGWNSWMVSPTHWTWILANWEIVEDTGAWCAAEHGVTKSQTWLSDWTATFPFYLFLFLVFIYLFIWLLRVLVVTQEIFGPYLWHVGSSSLTRNQTQALCIGSSES